ncbi:hypothetical protein HDU91_006756, partial [Kappamyces sp. JEL0680]
TQTELSASSASTAVAASDSGMSTGLKIGLVAAGIFVVIAIIGAVSFFYHKSKEGKRNNAVIDLLAKKDEPEGHLQRHDEWIKPAAPEPPLPVPVEVFPAGHPGAHPYGQASYQPQYGYDQSNAAVPYGQAQQFAPVPVAYAQPAYSQAGSQYSQGHAAYDHQYQQGASFSASQGQPQYPPQGNGSDVGGQPVYVNGIFVGYAAPEGTR